MKSLRFVCLGFVLLVGLCTPGICQSVGNTFLRDDGQRINASQKAASDQSMQAGLAQLEQAAAALQAGNAQAAYADMSAGYSDMAAAEPTYHGFREKALHEDKAAGDILSNRKKQAISRASSRLAIAITDAQTAVASW